MSEQVRVRLTEPASLHTKRLAAPAPCGSDSSQTHIPSVKTSDSYPTGHRSYDSTLTPAPRFGYGFSSARTRHRVLSSAGFCAPGNELAEDIAGLTASHLRFCDRPGKRRAVVVR
jgi:hypothetical protein